MADQRGQPTHLEYLDFEIEIGEGVGREYPVAVVRSPAGETRTTMAFPYDELELESRLKDLKIALLQSGGSRRLMLSTEEQTVNDLGRDLFEGLFCGDIRSRYDVSLREAAQQGKGLRIKMRFQSPSMAALPWEYLYDARQGEFVCLSRTTPLIRYLELPQPIQPLTVTPPLRILGMIASPRDLPALDAQREKQRVEQAVRSLRENGLIEVEWLAGQTWRDLQQATWQGPWHVFHFVGHGHFDAAGDEGIVALADDDGATNPLRATQLGRLLADHPSMRLVILNSCEGARGGGRDIFSSTASILVRRGIPAVLAMQDEITDRAAIEFARTFYEALACGMPVDAATVAGRVAISIAVNNSVEWGTPVLTMRSPDGVLFNLTGAPAPLKAAPPAALRPTEPAAPARRAPPIATPPPASDEFVEHPARVSETLILRTVNRLGVESEIGVSQIGVKDDPILEHLIRFRGGGGFGIRMYPNAIPLNFAPGVIMVIPWRVFKSAAKSPYGHEITLIDDRKVNGKFTTDLIGTGKMRQPLADIEQMELISAPESALKPRAKPGAVPPIIWQLDVIDPQGPSYGVCDPQFAFTTQTPHPMGAFTHGDTAKEFYLIMGGETDEKTLAYFDHFQSVAFESPNHITVTTLQGKETSGALAVSGTGASYYMSRNTVEKAGSSPTLLVCWAELPAIEILIRASKWQMRRV